MKFFTWLNSVALLIPKGKRNRENKLNLNEGTILCLLDRNKLFSNVVEKNYVNVNKNFERMFPMSKENKDLNVSKDNGAL